MDKHSMPHVKALMTAFPLHIDNQASIGEAQQLMRDNGVHHLVVTRKEGGFSLLSERELQHHRAIYGSDTDSPLLVDDICTEEAVCADINDPVDRILDIMAERHLGSVVILREAELAGIFTTTDACRHFAKHLRKQFGHDDIPDLTA